MIRWSSKFIFRGCDMDIDPIDESREYILIIEQDAGVSVTLHCSDAFLMKAEFALGKVIENILAEDRQLKN
jgi:hypothetical protein